VSADKKKKNKKKRKASTTLKRYPYSDSNQKFSAEDLTQGSGAHVVHGRLVQGFDVEDIKQYFAHNFEDLYGSDENRGCSDEDSDQSSYCGYNDDEYFGDHGEV